MRWPTSSGLRGSKVDALVSLISYDTFGFVAELALAAALLMVPEKRRDGFATRAVGCAVACVFGALLAAVTLCQGWLNLSRYLTLFGLVLVGMGACWELDCSEAVFFAVAAYNVQHCVWRLKIVLMVLGVGSVMDNSSPLTWLITFVMTGALALWFRWALRDNREAAVNSRQLVWIAALVLAADLVLSYLPFLNGATGATLDIAASSYATICCVLTLVLQSGMLTQSKLRQDQETLRELWAMDKRQYEQTQRSIDLINARSHDLKKQVHALLAAGSMSTEARAALEETRASIESYECRANTGCAALDALLTQKLMQAEAQGATLTYLVDGAGFAQLGEVDLYALFGNVLDNALEAVAKIAEPERRVINLKAKRRQGLLILRCENYADAAPQTDGDGAPVSSKDDRENHGFGLRSIAFVAERHGGHVTYGIDDGIFRIQVVMPEAVKC